MSVVCVERSLDIFLPSEARRSNASNASILFLAALVKFAETSLFFICLKHKVFLRLGQNIPKM